MVQKVPAHLGETTRESTSPWIMLVGVALLLIVACAVIFILLGGTSRFGLGLSASPTPTRKAATPAATLLPITAPAPASPTAGPTAAILKYKVKIGDNLTAIAAKYKVSIQAIMAANGMKDDTIRIGEELIIPLPTPTPPPGSQLPAPPGGTPTPISFQSPPTSATPAGTPGVIRYTVQRGDTLITIAAANGSTVDAIRAANQLDGDFISIGQVLLIPVGAWTPTAIPTLPALTTATPTAQFAYAAPDLMSPSNNTQFHGSQDAPQLMWLSVGMLKPNEFYVVHIDYAWGGEKKSIVRQVGQVTSVKLRAADYPGANASGTPFSWYVVVVSQTSGTKSAAPTPQMSAQSPTSATWTFVWY
ncbi:MAG: LysM peptidoglycan-binding domain-containing protein [Chloroflexota bacterium]|nr:LysM peptidoglycan-binding domain-containing protein [Chloroflexota bacterium]